MLASCRAVRMASAESAVQPISSAPEEIKGIEFKGCAEMRDGRINGPCVGSRIELVIDAGEAGRSASPGLDSGRLTHYSHACVSVLKVWPEGQHGNPPPYVQS